MSLKDLNRKALWFALAANAAIFYVLVQTNGYPTLAALSEVKHLVVLVPTGAAILFIGLMNSLLPSDAKARLVFLRWRHPLPGSRAFTKYGPADSRVDMQTVAKRFGPLPRGPVEQNKAWFRLFKTVENHPSVLQVHREFLLARDLTWFAAVFIVTFGATAYFVLPAWPATLYLVFLLGQLVVPMLAGRHNGIRFVGTVLALKGAGV